MENNTKTPVRGTIKTIAAGRSCTSVELELAGGKSVYATLTSSAACRMGLKVGVIVSALVLANKAIIDAIAQ